MSHTWFESNVAWMWCYNLSARCAIAQLKRRRRYHGGTNTGVLWRLLPWKHLEGQERWRDDDCSNRQPRNQGLKVVHVVPFLQCIRIYFVVAASRRVMLDLRTTIHSLFTGLEGNLFPFMYFQKESTCQRFVLATALKGNSKCTVCWVVLLCATYSRFLNPTVARFLEEIASLRVYTAVSQKL